MADSAQPFLTPGQQYALNAWNLKYREEMAALDAKDQSALARYNFTSAADTHRSAVSSNMTNQSMGARGLFQSSIRDNALNDLASTLAQQLNIARTNYNSTLLSDSIARTALSGQNTSTQSYYTGIASTNAQNIVPAAPPPASEINKGIPDALNGGSALGGFGIPNALNGGSPVSGITKGIGTV